MKVFSVLGFGSDDERWLQYPPDTPPYHGNWTEFTGQRTLLFHEAFIPPIVVSLGIPVFRKDVWEGTISRLLKLGEVLPSCMVRHRNVQLLHESSDKKLEKAFRSGKFLPGTDYFEPFRLRLSQTVDIKPDSDVAANRNATRGFYAEHTPVSVLEGYPLVSSTGGNMMREDLYEAILPHLDERFFLVECYELGNPNFLWRRP